jgi:hypothetical protein
VNVVVVKVVMVVLMIEVCVVAAVLSL